MSSLPIFILITILLANLTILTGCGTKQEEQEDDENIEEISDTLETPFYEEGEQSTLTLIQGNRVIGVSWDGGTDTAHVVVDVEGNGKERDIYVYNTSDQGLKISVGDGVRSMNLNEQIEGLNQQRKLPKGWTFEIAASHLTDNRAMDILCAVSDGDSEAHLTIFRFQSSEPNPFTRIGSVEGQTIFKIKSDHSIEAPFGKKGLSRVYKFNGSTFEEIQKPEF